MNSANESSSTAFAGGVRYLRIVVRTRWLTADDDLITMIRSAVGGVVMPGDTVVVSEKVAVLLTGRSVPFSTVQPGRLARLLASWVRPRPGSRGLSVPEKMQYVLERSGRMRLVLAAAASAVTRPLGVHGVFYRIAGRLARDIDGGRPPFEDLLFPPLTSSDAAALCTQLESGLDTGVAIVDINDFGGSIRATSPRSLPADKLRAVLADNPLGQRDQRTPIGVVCVADGSAAARSRALAHATGDRPPEL